MTAPQRIRLRTTPVTPAPDTGGDFDWRGQWLDPALAWGRKHKGAILKGGAALSGLGVLAGAANALDTPEESKLSNVAGAAGSLTAGLAGLAAAARFIPHPGVRMAGMALAPMIASPMGEGIARAGVSLFEDPAAKALRAAEKEADLAVRIEEMKSERLLPLRMQEAAAAQLLRQKELEQTAALESRKNLQETLSQGILNSPLINAQREAAMQQSALSALFG